MILTIVVLCIPACRTGIFGKGAKGGPINVLLLTVDTLRADHLSSYGYGRPTSPAIDRLASEGVLFERAMAQRGSTWPSIESIMTSKYPGSHGVRVNGQKLPPRHETMAQHLRRQGFRTAAFITNMVQAPNRGYDVKRTFVGPDRDDRATEAAIRWIEGGPQEPFFAWVHLFAPHADYRPPEPFRSRFLDPAYEGPLSGRLPELRRVMVEGPEPTPADLEHVRSLYDGEVAYTDASVEMILAALRDGGYEGRTLVAFTSDHGEDLYQHNRYFFHALSIYDSVLHIPLILRLPGVLEAGTKYGPVVESIDIAPTIFELLGLSRPADFQGTSLLGSIESGSRRENDMAFSERGSQIGSVRTARWRCVINRGGEDEEARRQSDISYPIAPEELYDLRDDPAESRNVAARYPDVTAGLRRAILAWRAKFDTAADLGTEIDPETLKELRALGYIR